MQTEILAGQKKNTEKKTDDFVWKISRRTQYDDKILLLKT